MAILQAVLALAIVLAWGPEIFAALEMTALLEMLGASLFLTAYAAGARLKAIELLQAFHSFVSPIGQMTVLRSSAPAGSKALALVSVIANTTWCLCGALVVGAFGHHLLKLAT